MHPGFKDTMSFWFIKVEHRGVNKGKCTMTPTRIPTPDMTYLQKLAQVNVHDAYTLDVFWSEETRKVVMNRRGNPSWYALEDGNIIESIDVFWGEEARTLAKKRGRNPTWFDRNLMDAWGLEIDTVADQLMVFDQKMRHGKARDAWEIYDCEWSDFACEKQVLQFRIRCV